MRKPSVTLTSPFGVEVVGLAVGGHGGGLRFGGFSFCSVSGFTKETHRRSVGSSPEASPPCAWELTALCFCLQGTSGPDPTTVYVDMRALRHDRYGAPAASPLGAGAACVRCGQSPEEQLPPAPRSRTRTPLTSEMWTARAAAWLPLGVARVRGCLPHRLTPPQPTRFSPELRHFREELKSSRAAFCAASERP